MSDAYVEDALLLGERAAGGVEEPEEHASLADAGQLARLLRAPLDRQDLISRGLRTQTPRARSINKLLTTRANSRIIQHCRQ